MFTEKLLIGRRILVTGGGTGLGKSMAARFLELGAEVHICGRRKGVCDETATELMDLNGGRVTSHGVDIRNPLAVDEMIGTIFTEGPLTDLINNAAGNFVSRTQDLTPRGFDAIANIVMHGTFYVTHAVGRRWIAGKHRGNVVSITVTWVRNGSPYVVPSAMSKSAIHAMTMSLATEWGRYGIRLNTIAPGEIPTEGMSKRIKPGDEAGARTKAMNPMGRVGKMEELQNLAVFLISGGCDWINGETIAMDGAQALAMGGNFYQLRDWSDADWTQARDSIKAQNEKDRAARGGRPPPFSMLPGPHIAEQKSRHLALLDFLAALGDAVAAVMPVDVFERLVTRIAHAAMYLHGAVGGLAAQPVRPVIAHRDLVGERVLDLRLRELIHLPRGLADQQPQHLRLGRKLHQRPLDRLVLGQRPPKGFAFPSVFHAFLDTVHGGAQ